MAQRRRVQESYAFNWGLTIPESMQWPFEVNHENMASLDLSRDLSRPKLVAELRKAFSEIVAGNVKPYGIRQIRKLGPYSLNGDPTLLKAIDSLLTDFVANARMKVGAKKYQPCYQRVNTGNKPVITE